MAEETNVQAQPSEASALQTELDALRAEVKRIQSLAKSQEFRAEEAERARDRLMGEVSHYSEALERAKSARGVNPPRAIELLKRWRTGAATDCRLPRETYELLEKLGEL